MVYDEPGCHRGCHSSHSPCHAVKVSKLGGQLWGLQVTQNVVGANILIKVNARWRCTAICCSITMLTVTFLKLKLLQQSYFILKAVCLYCEKSANTRIFLLTFIFLNTTIVQHLYLSANTDIFQFNKEVILIFVIYQSYVSTTKNISNRHISALTFSYVAKSQS